MNEKKRMRYQW